MRADLAASWHHEIGWSDGWRSAALKRVAMEQEAQEALGGPAGGSGAGENLKVANSAIVVEKERSSSPGLGGSGELAAPFRWKS
jgi:hypothetical protein